MGAMPVIEIKQNKTLNKLVQKEQSLTKINFFLDKRKRFRDLIRAHINKQINPFNEINKHFITSKRSFNKNNSVIHCLKKFESDKSKSP
jgi:predicted transcriptional regulator